MVGLPEGETRLKICLFVSTKSTNMSDRQRDRRTDAQTLHGGTELHAGPNFVTRPDPEKA